MNNQITVEKIKARIRENLNSEPSLHTMQAHVTSLDAVNAPIRSVSLDSQRMTLREHGNAFLWKYGIKYAGVIKKIPILKGIALKLYYKLSFDYYARPLIPQAHQSPTRGLVDMPWSYNRFRKQSGQDGLKGKLKLCLFTCLGFFASWQEQINEALFQAIIDQQAGTDSKLSQLEAGTDSKLSQLEAGTDSKLSQLEAGTDSKLSQLLDQAIANQQAAINNIYLSNSLRVINEIDHLLNTQVEHYQPIYGMPSTFFSTKAKRDCSDRAKIIENYFNNDFNNLRVLDIGSSLGYFCFYLADRGALAEGWDSNELNYYVSNLTKEINAITNASFLCRTLDLDTVKNIPYDKYDCALALSVFQHINNEHELAYSQNLIKSLLDKIPVLIVELANKNENTNVHWKDTLPPNELEFFSKLRNCKIQKIGEFGTHLSDIKRSMYVISQKYITVNNHKYLIDKVLYKPYESFRLPLQRRFYYTRNYFIKKYHLKFRLNNEENFKQIINEINILNLINDANVSHTTRLVDYELGKNNITLVLNKINGTLLSDVLNQLSNKAKGEIINHILEILCALESAGIFHNDIRSWNIIIDNNNEPYVIDFGLASLVEKENNLIAFAFLVNSLITNKSESETYNKESLPDFTRSTLYTKYIKPIRSGKIRSFKNLYDKII